MKKLKKRLELVENIELKKILEDNNIKTSQTTTKPIQKPLQKSK
jgi:hypothetical protein